MTDSSKKLFDPKNQYILFSGTNLNGNGAFRHLNDLFLILYVLVHKGIDKKQIYLSIDFEILDNLNIKTSEKKINLLGKEYTFSSFFTEHIAEENFIKTDELQKSFVRKKNDLIFFASGHGHVSGLALENFNGVDFDYDFISSDFFEDIAITENSTYLFLSQCQAGAFHHLDTRKNICVISASEYQNSISIPIKIMYNQPGIDNLSFEDNIAINPFIFSFFFVVLNLNNGIIINKKKNVINVFKYIASSTIEYVSSLYNNKKITITKEFLEKDGHKIEYKVDTLIIQQPFLLNKILASETYLD
jgi:hypothetical protein